MKKIYVTGFLLMSIAAVAQEPDSSSAVFKVREAERSFAKASVMNGRRDAFYEFLAEKSVIFTDKWITNGKEFWSYRPATPSVLKWEPEFTVASAGKDFGISTGPWEAQEYRPNTKTVGTGYFLSAWEIQQDGSWKVILDAGIASPSPQNPHSFSFAEATVKPKSIQGSSGESGPEATELKMLDKWKANPVGSTYESFFGTKVRVMRSGHLPSTNPDTIINWLSRMDKSILWKTSGSHVARSGDLGFTYGYIEMAKDSGNYVRFWQKDAEGNWKIIIDMLNIN
jgi:ketosteroid isomerase-like protein